MKTVFTLLIICIVTFRLGAQTTESISMGAGYANHVFWSLPNGTAGTAAINSWELAFRLGLQTSSIFINSANGVSLYHVPNVDTSGWLTLDTTGLQSWQQLYNSDSSWEFGAFDRSSTGFPDFSWGDYDFDTHIVTGDSLYVIKLNGAVKKLWIIKKDFGNWTFRFANIDNSGDQTVVLNGADYPNKNFAYYSITTASALNLEPDDTAWDIVFTRYLTLLQPGDMPYLVTGVQSNVGVTTAEARHVDLATVDLHDYDSSYTSNISEIGYDWKFFDGTSYIIEDSLCYFVKSLSGDIYKIVFTGFEGSATGNISWEQTNLLTAINPVNEILESAAIFPNPVKNQLNVIFSAAKATDHVDVNLYRVDGQNVFHSVVSAESGLNQRDFSLPSLGAGTYLLQLNSASDAIRLKVMIVP
jgi:hypothetical protein